MVPAKPIPADTKITAKEPKNIWFLLIQRPLFPLKGFSINYQDRYPNTKDNNDKNNISCIDGSNDNLILANANNG